MLACRHTIWSWSKVAQASTIRQATAVPAPPSALRRLPKYTADVTTLMGAPSVVSTSWVCRTRRRT
eukprot:1788868-Pyramimonas_sp.AAC.1